MASIRHIPNISRRRREPSQERTSYQRSVPDSTRDYVNAQIRGSRHKMLSHPSSFLDWQQLNMAQPDFPLYEDPDGWEDDVVVFPAADPIDAGYQSPRFHPWDAPPGPPGPDMHRISRGAIIYTPSDDGHYHDMHASRPRDRPHHLPRMVHFDPVVGVQEDRPRGRSPHIRNTTLPPPPHLTGNHHHRRHSSHRERRPAYVDDCHIIVPPPAPRPPRMATPPLDPLTDDLFPPAPSSYNDEGRHALWQAGLERQVNDARRHIFASRSSRKRRRSPLT